MRFYLFSALLSFALSCTRAPHAPSIGVNEAQSSANTSGDDSQGNTAEDCAPQVWQARRMSYPPQPHDGANDPSAHPSPYPIQPKEPQATTAMVLGIIAAVVIVIGAIVGKVLAMAGYGSRPHDREGEGLVADAPDEHGTSTVGKS